MLQDLLFCNSSFKFIRGTAHRLAIWQSGDQSVIKSCVRGDKSSFLRVFRFSFQKISWNCTPYRTVIGTADVGLAAIGQKISWWCLGFCLRDFPNNSHLSLYANLLKTMCGVSPIIRIKVGYLKSCVTGRLYLMSIYKCSWIFIRLYT